MIQCRVGCGACCIAPSIRTAMPGMPDGKPAGQPCLHLTEDYRCKLFGKPERPDFCGSLQASEEMCGSERHEAIRYLTWLEAATAPLTVREIGTIEAATSSGLQVSCVFERQIPTSKGQGATPPLAGGVEGRALQETCKPL